MWLSRAVKLFVTALRYAISSGGSEPSSDTSNSSIASKQSSHIPPLLANHEREFSLPVDLRDLHNDSHPSFITRLVDCENVHPKVVTPHQVWQTFCDELELVWRCRYFPAKIWHVFPLSVSPDMRNSDKRSFVDVFQTQ